MAEVANQLCDGSACQAERHFGWGRDTVEKGLQETRSGIRCLEDFAARGRRWSEDKDPRLAADIRAIVEPQTYADPDLKSPRRYTNPSAAEVREALVQRGYSEAGLPSERASLPGKPTCRWTRCARSPLPICSPRMFGPARARCCRSRSGRGTPGRTGGHARPDWCGRGEVRGRLLEGVILDGDLRIAVEYGGRPMHQQPDLIAKSVVAYLVIRDRSAGRSFGDAGELHECRCGSGMAPRERGWPAGMERGA